MNPEGALCEVTILHNTAPYREPVVLERVFDCWVTHDAMSDKEVLDACFNEFNVGETSDVAKAYRAKRLRSLSVNDVVVIYGSVAYRCDSVGWTAADLPRRVL
jgi:hypothetical protein